MACATKRVHSANRCEVLAAARRRCVQRGFVCTQRPFRKGHGNAVVTWTQLNAAAGDVLISGPMDSGWPVQRRALARSEIWQGKGQTPSPGPAATLKEKEPAQPNAPACFGAPRRTRGDWASEKA